MGDYGDAGIIEPVTAVKGSHWHGIFDGSPKTVSLFCPSFYLTSSEIENLGDMAYIRKFTNIANPEETSIYIAIYFSKEHLQNILHQNLTSINSVYYIINSRDCIVAASSPVLAGTYFMSYDTIQQTIGDTQEFTMGRILMQAFIWVTGKSAVPIGGWYLSFRRTACLRKARGCCLIPCTFTCFLCCWPAALRWLCPAILQEGFPRWWKR